MIDEKELENDTETEVDEEAESMSVLKDMISTLNELPTDVLRQLAENLDEVVLGAMKKHRQYDAFHENGKLTAEEIPEVLDSAIASITATKHRGITPDNIEGATSGVRIEGFRNASGSLSREMKELENEKDGTSLGDE